MLANALIRIEGRRRALPAPFELVVSSPDIWVLEFAVPRQGERNQLRWLTAALARKKSLLSQHSIAESGVLHLTFASKKPGPHLLAPPLLRVIAELRIGLEVYERQTA